MNPVSYYTIGSPRECGICYQENADMAHRGTCGDVNPICEECITEHLLTTETCPFCRTPVDVTSVPSFQERKVVEIHFPIPVAPAMAPPIIQSEIKLNLISSHLFGFFVGGLCGAPFPSKIQNHAMLIGAISGAIFGGMTYCLGRCCKRTEWRGRNLLYNNRLICKRLLICSSLVSTLFTFVIGIAMFDVGGRYEVPGQVLIYGSGALITGATGVSLGYFD